MVHVETLSLDEADNLVKETSNAIAVARKAKSDLVDFIDSHKIFYEKQASRLPEPQFSAYYASLEREFSDAAGRHQAHLQHMDVYITGLVQEQDKYVKQMRLKAHALSPIYRLLPEILGEIFTTCVMMDLGKREETYITPWLLAAVSSVWRETALSTPAVWSKIAVCIHRQWLRSYQTSRGPRDSGKGIWDLDVARTWFERSKAAPLYLTIECYSMEPSARVGLDRVAWIELLGSLSRRIVHFHLISIGPEDEMRRDEVATLLQNPFPRLESFMLAARIYPGTEAISLRGFSSLRTLKIHDAVNFRNNVVLEGGIRLDSLSIETPRDDPIVPALTHWLSPSIRTSLVHLHISHESSSSESTPSNIIELPNLTELWVQRFFNLFPSFSNIFSVPSLSRLQIEGRPRYSWRSGRGTPMREDPQSGKDTVTRFLQTTHFPSLRGFILRRVTDVDKELQTFLCAHPKLTSLTIGPEIEIPTTMAELAKRAELTATILCPCLRRLDISHGERDRLPDSVLEEIIRARCREGEPSGARLVSLRWYDQEMLH